MDNSTSSPNHMAFWDMQLGPMIAHLDQGSYRFPLIQQRFNTLVGRVRERYSIDQVSFTTCTKMTGAQAAKGLMLLMGCRLNDTGSEPEVVMSISALMERYLLLRRQYHFQYSLYFETICIIGILHELDHLALGLVSTKESGQDEIFEFETKVWAETCEHTLTPLRETYKQPITDGDMRYYNAWVYAKRDVTSRSWADFIRALYSQVQYVPSTK